MDELEGLKGDARATNSGTAPIGPGASLAGLPRFDLRELWPRLRRALSWSGALSLVFLVSVWVSLPTRSIAWRIAHEARQRGISLSVEDVSIRPWGSATLHEVVWSFAPSRPDSSPVPFVIEELDVSFSVLKYLLFDEIDVEFEGALDEGTIAGGYSTSEEESHIMVEIADLPLYSVPKLQDAVSAPVRGIFGLSIDLTMPEGKWSEAEGRMEVHCYSCTIGDGESKLYVPGTKKTSMLSKGVTIPEIDLGTLDGVLLVEDGKAVAEEFGNESDDIRIRIGGDITFKDPVGSSQLNLLIKVFVSPSLRERSDQLDLMVATASDKVKMDPPDEGWLGVYLEGNFKNRRFRGIKSKTKAEALLEKREARERRKKEAETKRAKAKADREAKAEADAKAREEVAALESADETGAEGDPAEDPAGGEAVPEVGVVQAELVPEQGEGGDEIGEAEGPAEEPVEEPPAEEPPAEEVPNPELPQ